MSSRICKDTARRLLRCFCGCTELTEDEVKHISLLSAQATLIDEKAVKLLRSFLERHRSGDKNEAEQSLDVYQKCESLLLQQGGILTLDELDELCELGLNYQLEKELKKQLQTGVSSNIERCLLHIQGECRNEIEASEDYRAYKQAILDKLKYRV